MARKLHRAERYMRAVIKGKIPACKWVKLACQRHIDDLKTAKERGFYFDPEAAQYAEDFFTEVLKHPQSSVHSEAGDPFVLEDWQVAMLIYIPFGWKRIADGTRKYRRIFCAIPKKNGKSTIASGLDIFLLTADNEISSLVYALAGSREQAGIVFNASKAMVEASPELIKICEPFKKTIIRQDTNSAFHVLASKVGTAHGWNAHAVTIDELHVQQNRELFDALWQAGKARRQPMFIMLTTAGYDRQSICYEMWEYTQRILEGVVQDDSYWGVIYTIDEGDDWTNPKTWQKANPNLGVTIPINTFEEEVQMAIAIPGYQNTFKRLALNVWTEQESRLITNEMWLANLKPLPALEGQVCFGGLDLAATNDIAAFVLDFAYDDEAHFWLPFFWIPEENIVERARSHGVNYEAWERDGFLRTTPGNVIDLRLIKKQIGELGEIYNIKQIAFDRWGAREVVADLQDMGFEMIDFGQGFKSMPAPTKEFLRLVASKKLHHAGNPVLSWMAGNLVAEQNAAGSIKPSKSKSKYKIDGIVAGIMGLDLALRHPETKSVYEDRGLRFI